MGSGPGTATPRVAYASALGCKLDVDFATGRTVAGAPATDNTGALNAFLATAGPRHPVKLILDGPALVRGLVIAPAGYTTIEGLGWGTGLYIADGANQDAIRIGPYLGGQTEGQGVRPIPPRAATGITLRDFAVFGNGQRCATGPRAGTTPPDQPVAGAPQHAVFGAALTNCQNILIDHVRFVNVACYAVMIANANDLAVRNCSFESGGIYQDGVHVNGPAERVLISDSVFATGDDAVALNCPEGFAGDIEDVHVRGCISKGSLTMMRLYTSLPGAVFRARRIVVADCTGSTFNGSFNLGIEGNQADLAPDQIEDLLITGCSFSAPSFANLLTPIGMLTIRDCVCRTSRVAPVLIVQSPAREIVLEGLVALHTRENAVAAAFLAVVAPGSVGKLSLRGVRAVSEGTFPPVAEVLAIDTHVEDLHVGSVDMAGFGAFVRGGDWSHIGRVRGEGLLATGAPIPEAKVAGNTFFSAAPDGKLAIKLQGAIKYLG